MNRTEYKLKETYGSWTVIGEVVRKKKSAVKCFVACKCECGLVRDLLVQNLIRGRTLRCMACSKKFITGPKRKKKLDKKYGSWEVIGEPYTKEDARKNGIPAKTCYVRCRCKCGIVKDVRTGDLNYGGTTQCMACGNRCRKRKK